MESNNSHKLQILVALIGLAGVIATAVFSNWDKIFAPTPKVEQTRAAEGPPHTKPESGATRDAGVLLKEGFEDNARGWAVYKPGTHYDAYLEDGKYVIENRTDLNASEVVPMKSPRPDNFDLEVSAIWRSGVKNHRYGLVLGVNKDTYYTFGVSGNGQVVVGLNKGGEGRGIPDPIDWRPGLSREGDGFTFNRLKVEVRGEKISYYVNGTPIGNINNTIVLDAWVTGVMVQGRQKVTFDDLVVTAK